MPSPAATPHPYPRPVWDGGVPLISPRQLAALRLSDEPPVLLDVRSSVERKRGHLPDDRHIPLAELPRRHGELPTGRAVVAYCHYGSEARRAAHFLEGLGHVPAIALEGGLDEYSRDVDPSIPRYQNPDGDGELVLQQLPRPETGCLAYLIGDPESRAAIVIDPGREPEPYLSRLRDGGWSLSAIIETHTHADHLAGHATLHARSDAPIYLSRRSPAQYPHRALSEGDAVELGREAVSVLETPGHTSDHLTLKVGSRVFTGDTLLIGGCGRTDLGDGSPERLWESLTEKLLKLPDDTEVYPAHFGRRHALVERYVSSIGFERATNEALTQGSRAAFLQYMTEGWPPKPADFDRIVATNLAE